MTNERKAWIAAIVIWTAIVASVAAPARPRPIEVACLSSGAVK
jgi:hypothetical protein